jgi:hypothetical protein
MKNRTKAFVSVILLIVYGTLTFVAVPLHYHQDPLFVTGSGAQAFVQHDDVLHCRHHVIESHDNCTLCTFTTQTAVTNVFSVLPRVNTKSLEYLSTSFVAAIHTNTPAHFRRGPPVGPA